MVLEFVISLWSFVQEFLKYLLSNLSSIPFTISLGAAVLLTMMYFANFVSDILLRTLAITVWFFVIITYFFPALIPKEYEFASIAIFAAMIAITTVAIKRYHKIREKTRVDKATSEVLAWLKSAQLLNPNQQIKEQDTKNKIMEILNKNKIT